VKNIKEIETSVSASTSHKPVFTKKELATLSQRIEILD
jgi:hypothetical protein